MKKSICLFLGFMVMFQMIGCSSKGKEIVGYAPYVMSIVTGWDEDKDYKLPAWRKTFSEDLPKSNVSIRITQAYKGGDEKVATLDGLH